MASPTPTRCSRDTRLQRLIANGEDEALSLGPRKAETIGRPAGDKAFLDQLERLAGRPLGRGKPGRKPRDN